MRTRGNKGELEAECLSAHPERVKRVFVAGRTLDVERIWWHSGRLVFQFAGVGSISAAEALEGADVTIPFEERAPLEEGEYYQWDLIGCRVIDVKTGQVLGEIEDWQEYGSAPLLVVRKADGNELLIPFAKSICREIDMASRRVVADLPEGLIDL